MQVKRFVKNKTNFKFQELNAQGAIEYLLIIGAAIIVVAILVLMISGILGSNTNNNDENVEVAFDQLKDITYKKIGYAVEVGKGETKEFLIDVDATEKNWV